ncbi:long-chain fatty acid--CoA ligase [Pseudonocardiaceae bacterium YIM PH 21723]|nr:long-chain fatty acid--CoA ligase [Pseudonocardiaceae bacterium YIM PH 21723]
MCASFQATVAAHPEVTALRIAGEPQGLTYREYGERVRRIAVGLAGLGVRHGDTVALMLRNRPEFNLVDMAILHLGATAFSIYNTSSPEQMEYLFGNGGNRVVVTEREFLDRVLEVRSRTGIELLISVDGGDGAVPLDKVETTSGDLDFEASWRAVRPEDLLTIIYTSGTTGPPKGVELTHANVVANSEIEAGLLRPAVGARLLSYLPSAHALDRIGINYFAASAGLELNIVRDPREVNAALLQVRPVMMAGVPRIWEKLQAIMEAAVAAEPDPAKQAAIHEAIELGRTVVRSQQARLTTGSDGPGPELLRRFEMAEQQVLRPLRAVAGLDQTRITLLGAAPSAPHMLEFFAAVGLPLLEAWGMTELTCLSTINSPEAPRFGTVGRPMPGIEVKLAEDGEVLARGRTMMRGYRHDPERTAETIGSDGWLRTGDLGVLEDGHLRIIGRKKELIINSSGKNMSPVNIECAIKGASPLIGQAICIGDRRPYNVALIVLDPQLAPLYPEPEREIASAVHRANTRLSRVEQIKRYLVLDTEWQPDSDELTATSKLRRTPIAEKYAEQIEQLYAATDQ